MNGSETVIYTLLGVALGSILSHLLEIHKARIQRRHTKFASYHSKQTELLTSVYSQLTQIKRYIDLIMVYLPNEDIPKDPLWINNFCNETFDTQKKIRVINHELREQVQDKALFISEKLEPDILKVLNDIAKFLKAYHDYTSLDFIGNPATTFSDLNKQIRQLTSDISNSRSKIRLIAKQDIVG